MSASGSLNPEVTAFYLRLATRLTAAPFDLATWSKERIEMLWTPNEKAPPVRSVTVEPKLRIAGYLDLDPGLLVVDSKLGTIGLVYRLGADSLAAAHEIIDQAAYLRHLLMMDAGADARPPRRPYTVECVLSVPSHGIESTLRDVFRSTARDTAFWHAVGANVLVCGDDQPIPDASISRAFSWLLSSTRAWFRESAPAPPSKVLRSVTLTNYRLPGIRVLELDPTVPVHLVHGQNGAGKSSLAEALELSVTGSAVRLQSKNITDYTEVIRNRHTKQTAEVSLQFDPPWTWSSPVVEHGVNNPLAPTIPISSFRLDQDTMDTLAREGPESRAEIFLRSFFPDEAAVRIDLDKARDTLNNLIRALPPELQTAFTTLSEEQKPKAIQLRFAWLEESRPPNASEREACEPLSRQALAVLRVFVPEVGVYLDTKEFSDWKHFDDVFKDLNEALERVRGRARVLGEAIRSARECLSEAAVLNWHPRVDAGGQREWYAVLEEWSEKIALADLAEKHWQVSKTLSDACRATNQNCLDLADTGLFAQSEESLAGTLAALDQLRKETAEERDRLHLQAMNSSASAQSSVSSTAEQPYLTDRQIRALNLAGESLIAPGPPSGATPPAQLGTTLYQAFTVDKTLVFAGVSIGSQGWAGTISAKLEEVAKAIAPMVNEADQIETRSQNSASYIGPMQRKDILKAVLDAAKAVQAAAQRTEAAFLNELRDQTFNDALKELMSLFTPARWAYDDVEVRRQNAGGKEKMELSISGAAGSRADLMLNTAELNVFTVALYLLAATRVPNPLGALLFDDPLQNMDELTVTTLARGLAKVLQVFPAKWSLVFFFHGEDDLERFRQDVPAAVYLLPWLSPSAASGDDHKITFEPLKSTHGSELQNLAPIVKSRIPQSKVGAAP